VKEFLDHAEIELNLSAESKGDLIRTIATLNKCRFHMVSYSPVTILIAEHLTEATMDTSFPGQPDCPVSYIIYR
jgi:hypothetical protein